MYESEQITVYQLKIFMLGISPMIWRRFKVHSNSTIADLHYILANRGTDTRTIQSYLGQQGV